MDIKLPGLNTTNFQFHLPGGEIRISGKWFNYGIIFLVMILDLNMWKNQIFYKPFVYGQYTDENHYIYTVAERDFLANASRSTLSYVWRWGQLNPQTNETYGSQDHKMNSRYEGLPLSTKGTAFIPALFAFALFGLLVKYFSKNRPPIKVKKTLQRDSASRPANNDKSSQKKGTLPDDVGGSSIPVPPHVASADDGSQSYASSKRGLSTNQTRNESSLMSLRSSRDGLNISRDHLNGSCDVHDGGVGKDVLRSTLRCDCSSDAPRSSSISDATIRRTSSAATETSRKYTRTTEDNNEGDDEKGQTEERQHTTS